MSEEIVELNVVEDRVDTADRVEIEIKGSIDIVEWTLVCLFIAIFVLLCGLLIWMAAK